MIGKNRASFQFYGFNILVLLHKNKSYIINKTNLINRFTAMC